MRSVLEQAADFAADFVARDWTIRQVINVNGRFMRFDIEHDDEHRARKIGRQRDRKQLCSNRSQYKGTATTQRLDELQRFYASAELSGIEVSPFEE